jgi:RNA polymerase-binding protein DksA
MDTDTARTRLLEEQERLTGLRASLQEEAGEPTGELSSADQHPADSGSDTFERAKELALLDRTQRQLADVGRALDRLDRGGYGICEACGEPIGTARLTARPAARLCLGDQELAEAEEAAAR